MGGHVGFVLMYPPVDATVLGMLMYTDVLTDFFVPPDGPRALALWVSRDLSHFLLVHRRLVHPGAV